MDISELDDRALASVRNRLRIFAGLEIVDWRGTHVIAHTDTSVDLENHGLDDGRRDPCHEHHTLRALDDAQLGVYTSRTENLQGISEPDSESRI
jgi:hypothetical protein